MSSVVSSSSSASHQSLQVCNLVSTSRKITIDLMTDIRQFEELSKYIQETISKNAANIKDGCNSINNLLEQNSLISRVSVRIADNVGSSKGQPSHKSISPETNNALISLQNHINNQKKLNVVKGKTLVFPYNFFSTVLNNKLYSFEENPQMNVEINLTASHINKGKEQITELIILIHGLYLAAKLGLSGFHPTKQNIIIRSDRQYVKTLRFSESNDQKEIKVSCIFSPTFTQLSSAIYDKGLVSPTNKTLTRLGDDIKALIEIYDLNNFIHSHLNDTKDEVKGKIRYDLRSLKGVYIFVEDLMQFSSK